MATISTGPLPLTADDLESRGYIPLVTEMAIIVLPLKMSSDAERLENFGNGSASPGVLACITDKYGDAPWQVPILPTVKVVLNPYKGGRYFSKHTIYCNYLRRIWVQLVDVAEAEREFASRRQQRGGATAETLRTSPEVGKAQTVWEGEKTERPYPMERDQKWCVA